MLGIPDEIKACLFDLDGVLTDTAKVHAQAWKQMFDDYLKTRAEAEDEAFEPFDADSDYDEYVDGKPREDGTRSFLESRDIELPEGDADDDPDDETVAGLGNRKNEILLQMIRDEGIEVFPGSVKFVKAARSAGLSTAVVSSSSNCKEALEAAKIENLFDARIDGVVAEREQLEGKPAPDTYLAGAKALGIGASEAAVFEDALAGVEAGRAGDFGCVIGVDRVGQAEALAEHGADRVVSDLSDLLDRS